MFKILMAYSIIILAQPATEIEKRAQHCTICRVYITGDFVSIKELIDKWIVILFHQDFELVFVLLNIIWIPFVDRSHITMGVAANK